MFTTKRIIVLLSAVLCGTGSAWGNLLTNGGFESGYATGDYGLLSPAAGWSAMTGTNNAKFDGTTHVMNPTHVEGSHWGSTDVQVPSLAKRTAVIYQIVNVQAGLLTHLTGDLGSGTTGLAHKHYIQIHDGATTAAAILAKFEINSNQDLDGGGVDGTWNRFSLTATPTGSQVTVSWGYDFDQATAPMGMWEIIATHVDNLNLYQDQPQCTGDPTITSVSPSFGANNGDRPVTVSGTNFDSTCQILLRRDALPDVPATGETVGGGGTTLTATLPLNGLETGKWSVVVTKNLCNDYTLPDGFTVAYPSLTNGSFEEATAGVPNGWIQSGISTGSGYLGLDSDQWVPTPGTKDGAHRASMLVPVGTSFSFWRVFQYVAVTPGQQITLSGWFAGGGRSTVKVILHDGDENGSQIGARTIVDRVGCPGLGYTWKFAAIGGSSANGLVTVEWHIDALDRVVAEAAVAHADALTLAPGAPPAEICDNGIDDDGDLKVDCYDPDCAAFPGCSPTPTEICNNGIDDDGNGRTDCEDPACANAEVCREICDNGIDDNQDCIVDNPTICDVCKTDCTDPACVGDPLCSEDCTNGVDDNGNGLVDCLDPVCANNPVCKCNSPFADADGDGDVDQADFGIMQSCFSGSDLISPQGHPGSYWCLCFDRNKSGAVEQADVASFENCMTGPYVSFAQNPPAGCTP